MKKRPRTKFTFTLTYPDESIKAMLQRKGHNVFYVFRPITDIVLYPGGSDVSPVFYGEKKMPKTSCDLTRDLVDAKAYREAVDRNIPQVGICRGAQFLHVMNGGSLFQHVDNHALKGGHIAADVESNDLFAVTSTHHQMMRNLAGGIALAVARESSRKECEQELVNYGTPDNNDYDDLEVVWHARTKTLCFQPHPEYHVKECHDYFFKLLERQMYPLIS